MDEHSASLAATGPTPPSAEPPTVPPPSPKVHPEQIIEDDPKSAVRVEESVGSIGQIDNPDGVLDRHEE